MTLRPPLAVRLVNTTAMGALAVVLFAGVLAADAWAVPFAVAGGAASAWFAWRCWSTRVEVGPEGVTLVNWLRVHRVPWSDVERFVYAAGDVSLRRRGGREHAVSAFSYGMARSSVMWPHAERSAKRLEEIRKRHRRR